MGSREGGSPEAPRGVFGSLPESDGGFRDRQIESSLVTTYWST